MVRRFDKTMRTRFSANAGFLLLSIEPPTKADSSTLPLYFLGATDELYGGLERSESDADSACSSRSIIAKLVQSRV